MCHLCHKLRSLEGLDSKAAKPLFTILSKLHKRVEPYLSDLWLWRLQNTVKLQRLLSRLPGGGAILEDVVKEIEHIKKQMVAHPPRLSTGNLNKLEEEISPNSSASVCLYKVHVIQQSHESMIANISKKAPVQGGKSPSQKLRKNKNPIEEYPGNDIDQPEARITYSVQLVEEWFARCEAAMARGEINSDSVSMASFVGSGTKKRLTLEVGTWKKLSWRGANDESNTSTNKFVLHQRSAFEGSLGAYGKSLQQIDLDRDAEYHVSTGSPTLLSSRSSVTNVGSLISLQPSRIKIGAPAVQLESPSFKFTPPPSDGSLSSFPRPGIPRPLGPSVSPDEETYDMVKKELSSGDRYRKRFSPQTSGDSPLIPSTPEFRYLLRKVAGGLINHYPQHFDGEQTKNEFKATTRHQFENHEDAARARRRRRAELNAKLPITEKYRENERQKYWTRQTLLE